MLKKEKKEVIIVESAASDILTKIAFALKKDGYKTVFISLVGGIELNLLKDSYDKTFDFGLKFFKISLSNLPKIFLFIIKRFSNALKLLFKIRKLKPYIVIGRTTPNWLYFLTKKYFKNCPVVYYPGDIRSFSYKNIDEAISKGIPKFEIAAESWAFRNADGIIHKGSEEELKFLDKEVLGKIEIKCPDIYFYPYCLKKFMVPMNCDKLSKKDKNIHLVYVGSIPADKLWWDGIKKIIDQKIYVHMYSKTNNLTEQEESKRVKEVFNLNLNSKYIILHEPVKQARLAKEISKYDYGIYSCTSLIEKAYEMTTGNKIASYLEAGLPSITTAPFKTTAKLLRKHNIGVVIEPDKLIDIKKILKLNKPEKFKKDIIRAREELEIIRHIPRMNKFFDKVLEYYKERNKNIILH